MLSRLKGYRKAVFIDLVVKDTGGFERVLIIAKVKGLDC